METDKNFDNVLELGYYCVPWILGSQLVGHLKLRFQQLAMKFETETETKDKVFVNVVVSIQYWDLTDKASETLFKLSNTRSQLQVYDFDVIKACIPKLNLDDAYGFKVVRMLIVDTKPDESVQRAMSEINVAARLRMVATERQETRKILQIKSAEGEAESKYPSGLHNTLQCQAIVEGWGDRVLGFAIKVPGTIVKEVVDVVLVTMYFETMKESWHTFKSSVVLVAKGPWVLMLTKTTWNETLAWSWTDGRMVRHSMNSSDRIWSLYEAEREPNWEDWTSLTTGLRDIVTGQQQFLYFYYPP